MDDLNAKLEALQQQLEATKAFLEPINDEATLINSEILQLQTTFHEQLDLLKKKRDQINEEKYQKQKAVNLLLSEMAAAKQAQEQAEAKAIADAKAAEDAKAMEAANAAFAERMDKLTIGAPWREMAKDHQMVGGRKVLQDRNVIIADVMGLGKTLTSIVTVEMAERATREASPERPFLGVEKEVFVTDGYREKLTGKFTQKNSYFGRQIAVDPHWENRYEFVPAHYEMQIVDGIERPVGRRVLYFCPNSLLRNVREEWRMWAPHRNAIYIGGMTKAERGFALSTYKNLADFVIICNYEAWRRDKALLSELASLNFDTIIIDEAHNIKDMKSVGFLGVKQIIDESTIRPEYIIPMTGTPILNRPQELFTMLHLINPNQFYRQQDFLLSYCEQDDEGHWKFAPGGLDLLMKKVSKHFLRRTKDDAGIKLPPQTIIHHDLTVDEETYPLQAKARKHMRDFAVIKINEAEGKVLAAPVLIALYTRLRQIETWPAGIIQRDPKTKEIILQLDVEESQKVDYVIHKNEEGEWDGLIPAAIEDERMVLFSQFKAPLHEIRDRVIRAGYRAVVFDGDTPQTLKEEIRADFDARFTPDRANSKWDIVLCNYKVGGVGLNLTAASQLIVLDEEWNPGKRDQAYGRLDRIGQTKPTTVHVVRAAETIDDWLAQIMDRKEALVQGFESAVSATSTKDFLNAIESGLI